MRTTYQSISKLIKHLNGKVLISIATRFCCVSFHYHYQTILILQITAHTASHEFKLSYLPTFKQITMTASKLSSRVSHYRHKKTT